MHSHRDGGNEGNYAAAIVLAAVLMQGCFESKGSSDKAAASSVSLAISSVGRSSSASSSQNSSSAAGPVLRSLSLSIPVAELQESHAAAATVTAAYADGTTKTFSSGITWQIGDPNVLETKGVRLIAKGEGTATARAKAAGKLSPARSVTVYKVVHGHRLPPEPDPAVNNASLLGVDRNSNGIRDDVERTVYLDDRYLHPIVRAVALQTAKAFQVLIKDVSKAKETFKELKKAMDCESYYKIYASFFNEPILIERKRWVVGEIESMQMNTTHRKTEYRIFNSYLSGGILSATPDNELKSQCDSLIPTVPVGMRE